MKKKLFSVALLVCACTGHILAQAPTASDCLSGDCQNGYGVKMDGKNKVEGVFKDGRLDDKHFKTTFPSGAVYDGDWGYFGLLFDGEGTYTSADGASYIGHWKKGHRDGRGTQFRADGTTEFSGMWKDDKPVPGSEIAPPTSAPTLAPESAASTPSVSPPPAAPEPAASAPSVSAEPDKGPDLLKSAQNSIIDAPSGGASPVTPHRITPSEMYDLLMDALKDEIEQSQKWARAMEANKSPVLHDDISLCRFTLERKIDQDLYKIRTAADVGGSKELRDEAIDYLNLEHEFSTLVLSRFENISAYTTQDERQKLLTTYHEYIKKREKKGQLLDTLFSAYAQKNNIEFETPKK